MYIEYLLFPILIYLVDTFSTLLRRVRRGERWYTAHRQHVYQRLTDCGLSHIQVSLFVTACTLAVGGTGLLTAGAGAGATSAGVLFAVAVVVFYLSSPRLFARRYVA